MFVVIAVLLGVLVVVTFVVSAGALIWGLVGALDSQPHRCPLCHRVRFAPLVNPTGVCWLCVHPHVYRMGHAMTHLRHGHRTA